MSERFGMADGRCFTNYESSRILNDKIMNNNNIPLADGYAYRQFIQKNSELPTPPPCLNTLPRVRDSRLPFNPSRQ